MIQSYRISNFISARLMVYLFLLAIINVDALFYMGHFNYILIINIIKSYNFY